MVRGINTYSVLLDSNYRDITIRFLEVRASAFNDVDYDGIMVRVEQK